HSFISFIPYSQTIIHFYLFFFYYSPPLPPLHSFPTRRSSDLLFQLLKVKLPYSPNIFLFLRKCCRARFATFKAKVSLLWPSRMRSEEHTSELQSLAYLVCRLLLEKKKKITI